jgi:phytoene/squalene synthetase
MNPSLSHCRQLLKQHDYPRYALSLALPKEQRNALWVLGAFNVEISRAAEMSEPATGAIRLKWWYEALEQPREHPVVTALHEGDYEFSFLQQAIESREMDLVPDYPFQSIKEMDAYATATGGFWAAMAKDKSQQAWLQALGQCWALQGTIWSIGYNLLQGRSVIPKEVSAAHQIDPLLAEEDISSQLCHIIQTLARRVEETRKRLEPPSDALLLSALSFVQWRCELMRAQPELVLQAHPPEKRLKMLWTMLVK